VVEAGEAATVGLAAAGSWIWSVGPAGEIAAGMGVVGTGRGVLSTSGGVAAAASSV